jgi:hypothetical protein
MPDVSAGTWPVDQGFKWTSLDCPKVMRDKNGPYELRRSADLRLLNLAIQNGFSGPWLCAWLAWRQSYWQAARMWLF